MQVFTVALTRQFALYRKCCSLTAAMFVVFMFIKITMKLFSPAASKVVPLIYVMLLCGIIIHLLRKLISYLRSTSLLYGRKIGAWRYGKNKMHYIGLNTEKSVIFVHWLWGSLGINNICTDHRPTYEMCNLCLSVTRRCTCWFTPL